MDQPVGWVVTDPAGNIVDSGPVTEAQMAALVGEPESVEPDEGGE